MSKKKKNKKKNKKKTSDNPKIKKLKNLECQRDSFFFNEVHYLKACVGKNKYETGWQAKFIANELYEMNKIRLDWYQCPYCNKWHLTSELHDK